MGFQLIGGYLGLVENVLEGNRMYVIKEEDDTDLKSRHGDLIFLTLEREEGSDIALACVELPVKDSAGVVVHVGLDEEGGCLGELLRQIAESDVSIHWPVPSCQNSYV